MDEVDPDLAEEDADLPPDDIHEADGDYQEADLGQGDGSNPVVYPLDEVLRVNHLQVRGTHNSYHVAPDITNPPPDWNYTHADLDVQLGEFGVRQIELDVHYEEEGTFGVYHIRRLDPSTTCERLVECLSVVKAWSDDHPDHHLVFVLVEPKDEMDNIPITGHYDELDSEIRSVWPADRMLTPDDVRRGYPTLRQAIEQEGWPSLGETRGRTMFVFIDSSHHRDGYLEGHPNLEGRAMFVRGGPEEGFGAILEYGDPVGHEAEIQSAARSGFLVRTAADEAGRTPEENRERAEAALRSGAHLISTDFPAPTEGSDYWLDLAGGTPSRCNPVTAPEECTARDIEALP